MWKRNSSIKYWAINCPNTNDWINDGYDTSAGRRTLTLEHNEQKWTRKEKELFHLPTNAYMGSIMQ